MSKIPETGNQAGNTNNITGVPLKTNADVTSVTVGKIDHENAKNLAKMRAGKAKFQGGGDHKTYR